MATPAASAAPPGSGPYNKGVRETPISLAARVGLGAREVGLIVKDRDIVRRLQEVFEEDWAKTELGKKEQKEFEKDRKLTTAENVVAAVSE